MRIINQDPNIKTLKLKERFNYALLAFIPLQKKTPSEILFNQNFESNSSLQKF